MIRHHALALILAATPFIAPGAALAQPVKPADRNAALKYAAVFYSTGPEVNQKISDTDVSKAGFDAAAAPAEFTAAAAEVKTYQANIQTLIDASKLRRCDFEIEYERGIGATLPHLSKVRSAARMLRVDARRLAMAGDAAGSAERLATIVRMANHTAGDDILISSLVAAAMINLAIEEGQAQFQAGKLTPATAAPLVEALKALNPGDPFHTKDAMRGEQRITLGWVKQSFHGDDAGRQLTQNEAVVATQLAGENAEAARTIAAMNQAQLYAAVDLLSPYYDLVIAAWDKPDSVAQLEALGRRVSNGEFGPLGQVFAPAVSRARQSSLRGEERIREFIAAASR